MNQGKGCASLNSNDCLILEAAVFLPECADNQFTTSITLNYFYWFKLKYITVKGWGRELQFGTLVPTKTLLAGPCPAGRKSVFSSSTGKLHEADVEDLLQMLQFREMLNCTWI